jgi:serine/threonine-protein kinase HipA
MAIRKLEVYLHDKKVGILKEKSDGKLSFKYYDGVDIDTPISIALPVRKKAYNDKECRPFFENLLPEGEIRKIVAQKELVSEENIFSLLDKIAGDCAGAISLYKEGQKKNSSKKSNLKEISQDELYKIINEQTTSPLLTNENIRLSLAGTQSKFAIFIDKKKMYYPNDRHFSTHLIKPESPTWKDLVINEYFCMKLAGELNIYTYPVKIINVKNKKALLINRYDRFNNGFQKIRLHQEDFCQALGYSSQRKYQQDGGPSFKDCFNFIKDNFNITELNKFMNILVFNYLIGNCDAHAKNFSVLYHPIFKTGKFRDVEYSNTNSIFLGPLKSLTPFYDLVSTDAYDKVSKKMAMKIGSTWDIRNVQKSDFYKVALDNKIKKREIDGLIANFKNIVEIAKDIKTDISNMGLDTSICSKIIKGIKKRLEKIS